MIRDTLKMSHFKVEFMRRDLLADNPMVWLLQVDRVLVDIRQAPLALQVQAFELDLDPHVPGAVDGRS